MCGEQALEGLLIGEGLAFVAVVFNFAGAGGEAAFAVVVEPAESLERLPEIVVNYRDRARNFACDPL